MSLRERVKSWISKARQQLRDLIHARHHSPVKSQERRELAKDVKAKRKELEELAAQLARIDARHRSREPNWQGHEAVLGEVGDFLVVKAAEFGLIVTSTTGGTHSATSFHYRRLAIDFGVVAALVGTSEARVREVAFQNWLDKNFPRSSEIFGPDGHYIKNGVRYAGMFPDHGDHVHVGNPLR